MLRPVAKFLRHVVPLSVHVDQRDYVTPLVTKSSLTVVRKLFLLIRAAAEEDAAADCRHGRHHGRLHRDPSLNASQHNLAETRLQRKLRQLPSDLEIHALKCLIVYRLNI